ncbi:MAG: hypothetical protein WD885_00690 [Candidatus Saccharimonadales bacterium]
MSAKRVFYGLVIVIFVLCILIVGAAVLGNTVFKNQVEKLSELKARSQVLEQQSISLIKAKQDVENYSELNDITKQIVPQDKDQARTVREIIKIAQESNVRLSGISFQPSSLGDSRAAASAASGEAAGSSTSSSSPEEAANSPAATNKALTQVQPVSGIPGVFSLGITLETDENDPVSYEQFLTFLEKLESNRRTAHVGRINIIPENNGADVTFSLTLNAFVRP